MRAVNRAVVRVVQVGSREAAARRVVGKGVRVAEAVREARGSDKVAARASLVDVRVREVVRGKELELNDSY